ncbi:MAG: type I-C CRISPR-associated protein Cas5c [Acidobacteria bacterium]|nr:type I-C CRISPR-associated protein Cas5c [Acidobacteriota bacterium]
MAYGVKLHVWGDYACFTRPEMKVERVSYDVMTPSAARGILEAIHWKPAIRWVIDRIEVLKPIRFDTVRRNELGGRVPAKKVREAMGRGDTVGLPTTIEDDRQQRAATVLRDVGYVIEARFVLTSAAKPDDTPAKHAAMFNRRAGRGQCFQRPYLGTREFPAHFAPARDGLSSALPSGQRNRDLGWMLHDIDYANGSSPRFFRAALRDGVVHVPSPDSEEVKG